MTPAEPSRTTVLWKDIWWIKSLILFVTSTLCYSILILTVKLVKRVKVYCRTCPDNAYANAEKTSPPTCAKRETDEAENKMAETDTTFREIFPPVLRQRRPRMHTTVAESNLKSLVETRKRSPESFVPAFPKYEDTMCRHCAEEKKLTKFGDEMFSRFDSGDVKYFQQTPFPVLLADTNPNSKSNNVSKMLNEPMSMHNLNYLRNKKINETRMGNFQQEDLINGQALAPSPPVKAQSPESGNNSAKITDGSERLQESFTRMRCSGDNCSLMEEEIHFEKKVNNSVKTEVPRQVNTATSDSQLGNLTYVRPYDPITIIDDLDVDNEMPPPHGLNGYRGGRCSVCHKHEILTCLCKSCTAHVLSMSKEPPNAAGHKNDADGPNNQEGFLDESFEDMEVLVSDGVTSILT